MLQHFSQPFGPDGVFLEESIFAVSFDIEILQHKHAHFTFFADVAGIFQILPDQRAEGKPVCFEPLVEIRISVTEPFIDSDLGKAFFPAAVFGEKIADSVRTVFSCKRIKPADAGTE